MKHINLIIEKIRQKPGLYIGKKNLDHLATFMSGYECALNIVSQDFPYFDSKFQRFIESKYGLTYCTSHWSKIISANTTEEEAFDLFLHYWDEMKKKTGETAGVSSVSSDKTTE